MEKINQNKTSGRSFNSSKPHCVWRDEYGYSLSRSKSKELWFRASKNKVLMFFLETTKKKKRCNLGQEIPTRKNATLSEDRELNQLRSGIVSWSYLSDQHQSPEFTSGSLLSGSSMVDDGNE
ncbi:hypothetical protein RJ640_010730 [Escallonia rubra]|uniref:Uncharacterized protein n=1 Tax=Escallonia rubra TaxID=112253 RepID=A0AA88UIL1_9ASTE|nr:hypothetical protein RJ640_010730 [Escallonia rubra]